MVVQPVKPWMSEEDVGSGARWNDAIAKALEETDFAIVCVTPENQHAPWLILEAGAIAKSLEVAHVVPLCIGLEPSQVKGPLEAFQDRSLTPTIPHLISPPSASRAPGGMWERSVHSMRRRIPERRSRTSCCRCWSRPNGSRGASGGGV